MVGSGFVVSTHNTEIDMVMSTWSRLTRCNRFVDRSGNPRQQPDIVSQADVVASCTLRDSYH